MAAILPPISCRGGVVYIWGGGSVYRLCARGHCLGGGRDCPVSSAPLYMVGRGRGLRRASGIQWGSFLCARAVVAFIQYCTIQVT
jgi:hypothetical protein